MIRYDCVIPSRWLMCSFIRWFGWTARGLVETIFARRSLSVSLTAVAFPENGRRRRELFDRYVQRHRSSSNSVGADRSTKSSFVAAKLTGIIVGFVEKLFGQISDSSLRPRNTVHVIRHGRNGSSANNGVVISYTDARKIRCRLPRDKGEVWFTHDSRVFMVVSVFYWSFNKLDLACQYVYVVVV